MKNTILFLLLIYTSLIHSQTFDQEMEKTAKKMADSFNQLDSMEIAVYPFYSDNKNHSSLSELISEDLSIYLNQNKIKFKIIDRSYMEQMLQEHQLNSEGLIDPSTAKQFGMLIAADVYISGKVQLFGNSIRIQMHAINTETGERTYSDYAKIPLDYELAKFLGIDDLKEREEEVSLYKSSNPNCAELKVGDYCIKNQLNQTIYIKISGGNDVLYNVFRTIIINPGETGCIKDLPSKFHYTYYIHLEDPNQPQTGGSFPKYQGNFSVIDCKSDFCVIK